MVSLLFGGLPTFGGSLFSGFISSHKVLTLLSGARYFRRIVTCGTLRYLQKYERQFKTYAAGDQTLTLKDCLTRLIFMKLNVIYFVIFKSVKISYIT